MLARKIQQLMTFFGLLIPDMSNEEEQMLDEALIRTYADFGITHDLSLIHILFHAMRQQHRAVQRPG